MAAEESKTIAPELEEVVEAGDTLIITDAKGQQFAITGRDSEDVIEFCKAFDTWLSARNLGNVQGPVLDSLFTLAVTRFKSLPDRIQWQLPSYRSPGIILPGHGH